MNRRTVVFVGIVALLLGLCGSLRAQDTPAASAQDSVALPPMGVYTRETIPGKIRPIPYPYIREADVLWSKIIWRVIDLRQKLNLPLYYPTRLMKDRKSITQTLYTAIREGEIQAYDPFPALMRPGDEFTKRMSINEVRGNLNMDTLMIDTVMVKGPDGRMTMQVKDGEIPWHEIKQLWIKEEWFFDSKLSIMQVRILGICPVRVYEDDRESMDAGAVGAPEDNEGAAPVVRNFKKTPVFWVYYPEARKILTKTAYYNPQNDSQVCSYDDLFFKRRFGSYIIRESNEYDNRSIADYILQGGIPQMRESQRIHNDVFNKEQDMWEY